ncbi:MAG: alpha-glucosidase [Bacillota bacterium]
MKLNRSSDGFGICFKEKELIRHSRKQPFLFAGKGKAAYNMHLGNFDISNYTIEKIALEDFEIHENGDKIHIELSRSGINAVSITLYTENNRLIVEFQSKSEGVNRLWIRIPSESSEYIYGCGEQFSHFNLRGKSFPLFITEQGVGRNKKTYSTFMADCLEGAGGDYYSTYFPQPTFISSSKYYCHVDDSSYMEFNFKSSEHHELEIWNIPDRLIFGAQDSYTELLGDLTELLGRQPELPDWVYNGVWIGMQGGTETIKRKLDNALEKGLLVSGVWAQDWEGKRITYFGKRLMWNWEWDRNLYPELDIEIKGFREKGIRFLGYINPYLAVEGNLFKEAAQKSYLVKKASGEDYITDMGAFMAGHVDLTNPEAFNWYKDVIKKNMIDFGLSGWMADFGEYLPTDAILHNGISAEIMHNQWPVLWAKVNREAVEESGKLGDIVFFMRAGYTGSQRYATMIWAGDQNVDWSTDDGLPSVMTAALSLGMSGFGLHHSDIGGYTTLFDMKRTKELFMRWAEMGAFAPVMRTHEGNRPDDNWQFDSDEDTLFHFARMSRIYTKLAPYIKAAVKENTLKGIPVIRPLFLHYEKDSRCFDIQSQFMLGKDILAAPVYEEGKSVRSLYLPKDNWVHFWTGKEYTGGDIEVEAKLGYPPVFYRKDSRYSSLFSEIGRL